MRGPLVFLAFGISAIAALKDAGVPEAQSVLRPHPAVGDAVLTLANPFVLGNKILNRQNAVPIAW